MLKESLLSMATRFGLSVGLTSEIEAVKSLIADLHPVLSGHELKRFGSYEDGGYLIPDDLLNILAVFSPGVDVKASFEAEFVRRGIPCFLCDASVESAPFEHPDVEFVKKFVGVVNDDRTTTMDAWVRGRVGAVGDLLLQMDIEGAEWPVLLNISDEVLTRFRIVVIELHYLEKLFDRQGFRVIEGALRRLLQHFAVVHNHPNNCMGTVSAGGLTIPRVLELTFLRRDRLQASGYASAFPHPLDRPNVPNRPDLVLPKQWYRAAPGSA